MDPALIDTDILSLFMRDHPQVVTRFGEYLAIHDTIRFSIITFYEIMSGLKHRDAQRQLHAFEMLAAQSLVVPLTLQSVAISADLYARLRTAGTPLDDIDLLIAGTAMAHGLTLVTRNRKHFTRIPDLTVMDWSEEAT